MDTQSISLLAYLLFIITGRTLSSKLITPLYVINFLNEGFVGGNSLIKIVGPPWKEGEIRLSVDKSRNVLL